MENIDYILEESILESEIVNLILEVKSIGSLKHIQRAINLKKKQVA